LAQLAPSVPAPLAAVVDRCLRKRPEDRYATGEALADALGQALAASLPAGRDADPAFPPDMPAVVSEGQAGAIWRRAAQLQAEALQRLERRRDLLPRAQGSGARGEATRPDGAEAERPTSGYRLADVAVAAEEAGISRQYVAMALAELPPGALTAAAPATPAGVSESQATLFLGTDERSLGVAHVVPAPPGRTLRALGVVLQQAPYELQLRETVGAHPLDGGVIVFDLTGPIVGAGGAAASAVNFYWMGTHQQLQARQLQVTLRALPGQPERTELTMTCDLRPGVRANIRASQWTAGAVASGGGLAVGAVLAKGSAVVASLAVLGPVAAIGVGAAAASLAFYRSYYPRVLRKARGEMLRALQAVGAAVQSEDVFGTLPGPGRTARGGGGDDGSIVITV
jgi:hypothetical protein